MSPKPPNGPRVPPPNPDDAEQGKRFRQAARGLLNATLHVKAEAGPVRRLYVPAHIAGGLTDKVKTVLQEVGGGYVPMFYGALGGASMTLFFGDPMPDDTQEQLPIQLTAAHARRVAELIDLEGEDLFRRAVELGRPAEVYSELAHYVESEGFTLTWHPVGDEPRILVPTRAAEQVQVLTAEPPSDERDMEVYGELYRVITDRKEDQLGTLGIRLFEWSSRPPTRGGVLRHTVIAPYRDPEVEDAIKAGLIGEPVKAKLLIRQPRPGLSIDPQHVSIEVVEIARGPSERSRLGEPLFGD